MPSKQRLPQFLATSMDALERKLAQFDIAMRADLAQDARADREEAIAALQQKLEDAHALIFEQDQLLQASLMAAPSGLNSSRRAADAFDLDHLETIAEDLALQQRELLQQQRHIAQERELLRAQAMKLDQDRLAFEVRASVFVRLAELVAVVRWPLTHRGMDGQVERHELVQSVGSRRTAADVVTPVQLQPTRPRQVNLDVSMDSPVRMPVPGESSFCCCCGSLVCADKCICGPCVALCVVVRRSVADDRRVAREDGHRRVRVVAHGAMTRTSQTQELRCVVETTLFACASSAVE